jgi:hypothetical protein
MCRLNCADVLNVMTRFMESIELVARMPDMFGASETVVLTSLATVEYGKIVGAG